MRHRSKRVRPRTKYTIAPSAPQRLNRKRYLLFRVGPPFGRPAFRWPRTTGTIHTYMVTRGQLKPFLEHPVRRVQRRGRELRVYGPGYTCIYIQRIQRDDDKFENYSTANNGGPKRSILSGSCFKLTPSGGRPAVYADACNNVQYVVWTMMRVSTPIFISRPHTDWRRSAGTVWPLYDDRSHKRRWIILYDLLQ